MAKYFKTSIKKASDKGQQIKERDKMKVFCRIRSLQDENDISCIKFLSNNTVALTPPTTSVSSQNGNYREIHCTFHHVFGEDATQETIFEHTTLPLINELFKGRNCLLFAYGLSGSGKTYSMTGTPQNAGIIPHSLDVIFNSIMHLQAEKFVFKPDKMNGFEVQSEEDARKERQRELAAYMKSAAPQRFIKSDDSTEYGQQTSHCVQLENIDEDSIYAVFVSCVEIYNNVVYDLLEHTPYHGKLKHLQRKLVREDGAHNMYVHGVVEVEVKSSKEAREIFYKGMHRKRTAFTFLNSDSSRSHSVFTIRVVQAVIHRSGGAPEQKQAYRVSQLCLVDLAGSERAGSTKNTGQRLMESGNINNSLMILKICLETLRENQLLRTKKLVPYRDSKLTYLFKNFFERESCVHALVCFNPRVADFDEAIHVTKFADTVKEVQAQHSSSTVRNPLFPFGRRRANQDASQKMEQDNQVHSSEEISSLSAAVPCLELQDPKDDKLINELAVFLEHKNEQYHLLRRNRFQKEKEFHNQLEAVLQKNYLAVHETTMLRAILDCQKIRSTTLEVKMNKLCSSVQQLQQELDNKNKAISMMKRELEEKERQLHNLILENSQIEDMCDAKLPAEIYKGVCNMQVLQSKQENKVKLEEKERQLHNLILENSQIEDMCDAKLPAEIYKGVCNMQVLQSKQENKVKRRAEEKIKSLTKLKYIVMDELNYSAPSSSYQIEHKSAEIAMHSTESELQNSESSGVASLHSIQNHVQALTTVLSGKKITANVVPEAQNGMENMSKHSPFSSPSRRRKSIASPVILAEDESNTSAVA